MHPHRLKNPFENPKFTADQIIFEKTEAILEADFRRIRDEQKDELKTSLELACFSRIDEKLENPKIVCTQVLDAICSICNIVPPVIIEFVMSQAGRDFIETYVFDHAGWEVTSCGDCDDPYCCIVMTSKFAKMFEEFKSLEPEQKIQYLEASKARQLISFLLGR